MPGSSGEEDDDLELGTSSREEDRPQNDTLREYIKDKYTLRISP